MSPSIVINQVHVIWCGWFNLGFPFQQKGEREDRKALSISALHFLHSVFTPASFKIIGFIWKKILNAFKNLGKKHTIYPKRASINHTIRAGQWNWFKCYFSGYWRHLMRYCIISSYVQIYHTNREKKKNQNAHLYPLWTSACISSSDSRKAAQSYSWWMHLLIHVFIFWKSLSLLKLSTKEKKHKNIEHKKHKEKKYKTFW